MAEQEPKKRFRSWGETQIGRMLDRYGIPFFYEHPLAVIDEGKNKIWYPDFQLSGYGVLIEYCGRPDDPAYAAGTTHKQAVYAANGLTALMLVPDVFQGDWPNRILDQVEGVLAQRLDAFRAARSRPPSWRNRRAGHLPG